MLEINDEASIMNEGGNDGERRISDPEPDPANDSSIILAR
jgi:hypothetical protein